MKFWLSCIKKWSNLGVKPSKVKQFQVSVAYKAKNIDFFFLKGKNTYGKNVYDPKIDASILKNI